MTDKCENRYIPIEIFDDCNKLENILKEKINPKAKFVKDLGFLVNEHWTDEQLESYLKR